jgi:hypothetical protein
MWRTSKDVGGVLMSAVQLIATAMCRDRQQWDGVGEQHCIRANNSVIVTGHSIGAG